MAKLEWPEELWDPSPLYVGDLSSFFKRDRPNAPIVATMHVKVEPSRDHACVAFSIGQQNDGTFIIGNNDEIFWHTLHKKLTQNAVPKAHEYILKCFRDAVNAAIRA